MSQHPVKASERVAAMAGEPFPEPPHASEVWRARLGIALAGALSFVLLAQRAGLLTLSPWVLYTAALLASQLLWANITLLRRESAYRRNGRPLRREPPGPGQRALSPHTRGRLVYVIEALAALATAVLTLLVGAHLLLPDPHPLIYVACACFFVVCAIPILYPKLGARR